MIFDGIKFKKSKTIVTFPEDREKNPDNYQYIRFGKVCDKDKPGAVKTTYTYTDSGEPVYAKPIDEKWSWSLTNMMYGGHYRGKKWGELRIRVYLMRGGVCYSGSYEIPQEKEEEYLENAKKRA